MVLYSGHLATERPSLSSSSSILNKNLDSTFDVIKKELGGYSKKPEYKQVIQKLVDYSKKVLAKEIVVRCREEDKSFLSWPSLN